MANLEVEDEQYRRVLTKHLRPGDVVVWGQRHELRLTVTKVVRASKVVRHNWRQRIVYAVDLAGQLERAQLAHPRDVWWVLR